jgi:hypothetical protein
MCDRASNTGRNCGRPAALTRYRRSSLAGGIAEGTDVLVTTPSRTTYESSPIAQDSSFTANSPRARAATSKAKWPSRPSGSVISVRIPKCVGCPEDRRRTSWIPPRSRSAWSSELWSESEISRSASSVLLFPEPLGPTRNMTGPSVRSQAAMLR